MPDAYKNQLIECDLGSSTGLFGQGCGIERAARSVYSKSARDEQHAKDVSYRIGFGFARGRRGSCLRKPGTPENAARPETAGDADGRLFEPTLLRTEADNGSLFLTRDFIEQRDQALDVIACRFE